MPKQQDKPAPLPTVEWRGESIPSLVLGTAQLGIPGYGAGSKVRIDTQEAADAVVAAAIEEGIRCFDTARGYGDSEAKLRQALEKVGIPWCETKVITKIDPAVDPRDPAAVGAALEHSLSALGGRPLWAVMLHRFSWLEEWNRGLRDILLRARDHGMVRHLGVSVYEPDEALTAIDHPDMDVIQVPANAWDHRLARNGAFAGARRRNKLLFVRSVFLQGLLLMRPDEAEAKVRGAGLPAALWAEFCRRQTLSPLRAALAWAANTGFPLVVGAETPEQVREIAGAVKSGQPFPADELDWREDGNVVNPSLWIRGQASPARRRANDEPGRCVARK